MADVALVCGGSGALGAAVVEAFLARGDRVVSAARRAHAGEDGRVRHEAVDLTDADEVEALWERLDADGDLPRWLVNTVGAFRGGTVATTVQEDYRFLKAVNLDATWWSCRAAASRLPEGAAIVNVAARPALVGGAGSAAYAVSKAAVLRLTQVLSDELRERRVRVNAVLPSIMDTQTNRRRLRGTDAQIGFDRRRRCRDLRAPLSRASRARARARRPRGPGTRAADSQSAAASTRLLSIMVLGDRAYAARTRCRRERPDRRQGAPSVPRGAR